MMNCQALSTHMAVDHGAAAAAAMVEMTCVLKVNPHCWECKKKLEEVMQCTKGLYTSITMDGESQKVKITGRADPNLLMQVLSRRNGHAEVVMIQLDNSGESAYEKYYKYDHHYMTNYGNPYNHHPRDDPYAYNGHYQPALAAEPCYGDYYNPAHYDDYYRPTPRCSCNIM